MLNVELFADYPVFEGLDLRQIAYIVNSMKHRHFKAGEYIIRENTQGSSLFLLTEGKVKITKRLTLAIEGLAADEKQLSSATAADRPAFGENGLVSSGKRTANIIAMTDCELYELQKSDFDRIVAEDVVIGYYMMRNTCASLARLLAGMDENLLKFATALSIAVKM